VVAWRRVTPRSFVRVIRMPVLFTAIALLALIAFTDAKSVPSLVMFSFVAFVLAVVAQEIRRGASGSPGERGRVLAVGAGPPHRIWIGAAIAMLDSLVAAWPSPEARLRRVRSLYGSRLRHELSRAWGGAAPSQPWACLQSLSRGFQTAAQAAPLLR
jgi:hypothetical protein